MFEIGHLQAPAEDLARVTPQPPPSLVQIQMLAISSQCMGQSFPCCKDWVGLKGFQNPFNLLGTELTCTLPLSLQQVVSTSRSLVLQQLQP